MHHVVVGSLPELEQRSPTGKFHSFCRNVSIALSGKRNLGLSGGGHPFDVQIRRLPPSAAVCPFHAHLGQWELFLIRRGTGTVRAGALTVAVKPDDVFIHPPGEPHQLTNTGPGELEVLVVADNPPLDVCHYPDSDKWALNHLGSVFRVAAADYFDGEDPVPAGGTAPLPPAPPVLPPVATPFADRFRNLAEIPWEEWASPRGVFRGAGRQVSLALGARPNTPTGLGGHPFDLELGRLAPGQRGNPFHRHAAQWELFLILDGTGTVRCGAETRPVNAGEAVLHPPGSDAHDLTNTGTHDLIYLLVADNPPLDVWHYPDSGKWGISSPRMFFRPKTTDQYDGEE